MSSSQKLMKELRSQYLFLSLSIAVLFLLIPIIATAQQILVIDEKDQPLTGVEVFTTDYNYTAITNLDGVVNLGDDFDVGSGLTFRYLGYNIISLDLTTIRSQAYVVTMTPADLLIDEVVVFGRREVAQQEIPYQIATIKAKDIASTHAQTSADALAQHGGVFIQKSQMGGGSPLIRGFEANRVLLVVDGVRLNNAIYRSGHLQNAITVDQAILEKMEVIFGPNSLLYGSDALGGVVHFSTRSPKLSFTDKLETELGYYTRYASANGEKSIHADFSVGGKTWGSLTSVTYADYSDLRAGGNRDDQFPNFGKRLTFQSRQSQEDVAFTNENSNIQVGTGYNQIDIAQKILYVPNEHQRLTANIHYSTSTDVPRYDNLSEIINGELRWGEWNYGPQTRVLGSVDYRLLKPNVIWDDLAVIGAFQHIDEDRISRRWQSDIRSYQEEDVDVYSLTIDASKYINSKKNARLSYGIDIQYNDLLSAAYNEDINTGTIFPDQLTRYASGDNSYTGAGIYATLNGIIGDERLRYNTGLRYSANTYTLQYDRSDPVDWPADFYNGVDGSNNAITWSIGGTWLGVDGWNIRSMISTAFRSPNIDDLAKVRVNSDEITFPNLELTPEKSINTELTIAKRFEGGFNFSATGFYTRLTDAIVRKSGFAPNGQSVWITQGDALNVVANQNAEKATIYGISANASYKISSVLNAKASLNYTKGREDLDGGETAPFAHIPPLYGQLGISYDLQPWQLRASYRFNGIKSIEDFGGTVDNPDLATPIGSLAWSTFNLYTDYRFSKQLCLSVALENILDKHYRPFGSGVSAPGRNLVLSVRGRF